MIPTLCSFLEQRRTHVRWQGVFGVFFLTTYSRLEVSAHFPEFCFFFLRFYLFVHERHSEREAETQAEGEAGIIQRA